MTTDNVEENVSALTQLLLNEAKKGEPCQAEVCADIVSESKIVFENTDYSVATTSHSVTFGLRVISKNRVGFVTTNGLDPRNLKEKVHEAQWLAKLSPENPSNQIAPLQKVAGSFELVDREIQKLSPAQLLESLSILVDESKKHPHVTLDRAEMTLVRSTRILHNSNGVFQNASQALSHWFVMGMARKGEEVTSFDYEADSANDFSRMETAVRETGALFRDSVVESLGARTGSSYKGPVLFHPAAVSSLIASVVGFNINGRAQQDGMSRWKDVLGESVASKLLSLSENPNDETRPSEWTPFDREGVPTQNRDIIRNGVLSFTAHNVFSALRANTGPTGNAIGGARVIPGIGVHALSVEKGQSSMADLYGALGTGLVLKRFSGNADPVSGQFSGVAKNSWWVEGGKRAFPLKEVMVAGNMFDLLNQIKLVGSDVHRQMGSFDSPYMLIDGVSVTGH